MKKIARISYKCPHFRNVMVVDNSKYILSTQARISYKQPIETWNCLRWSRPKEVKKENAMKLFEILDSQKMLGGST